MTTRHAGALLILALGSVLRGEAAAALQDPETRLIEIAAPLATTKTVVDGGTVTKVAVDSRTNNYRFRPVLSADQRTLYLMQSGMGLRKIKTQGFLEEHRLEMERPFGGLALTAEGLMIHTSSPKDPAKDHALWIVDPDSLAVKRKIPISPTPTPICSAGSSLAFYGNREKLTIVDLKAGKVAREYPTDDLSKMALKAKKHKKVTAQRFFEFTPVALTPDGKTLICSTVGSLVRFEATLTTLRCEEIGPPDVSNAVTVSPDSKLIAALSTKDPGLPDHPKLSGYGTYVYKVSDLQKPVVSVAEGRVFAIDPDSGKMAALHRDTDGTSFLDILDTGGKRESRTALQTTFWVTRVFPLLKSGALLVSYEDENPPFLLWVEPGK